MSVRRSLELIHREAAGLAGEISLLLTRDTITKRDVVRAVTRVDRLTNLGIQLRAITKLPLGEER